jgi:SAM-dependent methyltransferase
VVGDVENLPIAAASSSAVLGFESFHHVPDRRQAMRGFARVLTPGGRVVLAEPDGAHEHAQVSVDVMEKYGILEKGMDLADVEDYVRDSGLAPPEQLYVVRAPARLLDPAFAKQHSAVVGNIFRVPVAGTSPAPPAGPPVPPSPSPPAPPSAAPPARGNLRAALGRVRAWLRPGP